MIATCPNCGRQHQVKADLAGKRAKCSCGQIMTIPAAELAPLAPSELVANVAASPDIAASPVVCEYRYGVPLRSFWILIAVAWLFGIAGIPMALFVNEGWALGGGRAELPPWCMTMVFGLGGVAFLGIAGYYTGGYFFQRQNPQRVAITTTGIIVPKGRFSTQELAIPFSEIRWKVMHAGPFLQANLKHGQGTTQLHSGLFPSGEAAETFVEHLQDKAG